MRMSSTERARWELVALGWTQGGAQHTDTRGLYFRVGMVLVLLLV
jgi:hypothetical protein